MRQARHSRQDGATPDAAPGTSRLEFATSKAGEPVHDFMVDVFGAINALARAHAVDANCVVNALAAGLGQMVSGELSPESRAKVCDVIAQIVVANAELEARRRLLGATAGSA